MTLDEFQTLKEFARSIGLFVEDTGWSLPESFTIKIINDRQAPAVLDFTYANLGDCFGMPAHFSKKYAGKLVHTEKIVYRISETKLAYVKKRLKNYASAIKRWQENDKLKELNKDFK